MKNIFSAIVCLFLTMTALAQNREINFEPKQNTLAQALEKARQQGKTVFVDCYTTYCGPCREMAATVFKTDSVADFFNSTFVNVKLDMLSEDGKRYSGTYAVGAYPTYLLLKPDGTMQYKFVGGMSADKFMARIREGVNPANGLATMEKTYASGAYSNAFLLEYIKAKVENSEYDTARKLSRELTERLSPQEKASREFWYLYSNRYVGGVRTDNFEYLVNHWDDFVPTIGRDTVYSRIAEMVRTTAEWALQGWMWKDHKRDDTYFNSLHDKVMLIPMPDKNGLADIIEICSAAAREDSAQVRKLFIDRIILWDEENQKSLFSGFGYFYDHKDEQKQIIRILLNQGRKNNLTDFLRSLLPEDEAYMGDKYSPDNIIARASSTAAVPFFHPTKPSFWYVWSDSHGKRQYFSYSPEKGKQPLYNQAVIDSLVSVLYKDAPQPTISYDPCFNKDGVEAQLTVSGTSYVYDRDAKTLTVTEPRDYKKIPPYGTAPDQRHRLIVEKGDLWQEEINPEETENILYGKPYESRNRKRLTSDAAEDYTFMLTDMEWLTDSTYYITRKDSRGVRHFPIMYTTCFGAPMSKEYTYELPGDTIVERTELFVGNILTGRLTKVDVKRWQCQEIEIVKTPDIAAKVYFLRRRKTRDEVELCAADVSTGRVSTLIDEVSHPYINPDLFSVKILNKGKDIILWSDRSGWGHYYLYDGNGRLRNQITKGEWTAGRIMRVDTLRRQLFFYGYGREQGRMPSAAQLYRISFNGKGLQLLTTENADHSIFISNDGSLVLDNYSRPDLLPHTVVRSATDGHILCSLQTADLSRLESYGWRFPETFKVKAADGQTDLYGIMWKPYDFDETRKYPVVSQVYPGPFTDTVWPGFTLVDKYNNATLAQAGFIVVVVGHRGSSPYRSKTYATFGYGNLRDYPLADDVAALKQLCSIHPFMDADRIGIIGHSGGAMMAVTALCTYPEVYKVAVASSGNYDNTIYNRMWGETYQGISGDNAAFKVDLVASLIKDMRGKLLLVTGETDQNVHPAHTMRLVDELIKWGKKFDFLVLPGQEHHYNEPYNTYFEHRKRDFLLEGLKLEQ